MDPHHILPSIESALALSEANLAMLKEKIYKLCDDGINLYSPNEMRKVFQQIKDLLK